ncbi:hypothetical protein Dform_01775 [Dehalogenimonas formicexedens]|uniref:Uncharacterized protein n=1 Tax=Dehalogenimonas formicexedens TaxID=1839801 RepID=A0A1P8F9F6_9CHLR|nr:hypothetical protein [Dehalogenimonas formicexedens]APV45094.1 hypothetical protein Dform_01775 [Dehalogenimonas formicexedens]
MKQESCRERLNGELKDRLRDIRTLWRLYQKHPDASHPELGKFEEYGLGLDYVAKGTFQDQKRGYFRWQLSWGGPADEFRFFMDENLEAVEIEYWFLDWNDGASKTLSGDAFKLLDEIFQHLKDMGVVDAERAKALSS